LPCALTIAGSDSGGGAGIQADLKTFAALGVHGTCAITAVTAQSPNGVLRIQGIAPQVVADQVEAVVSAFKPGAIKTGMLYSAEIIRKLIPWLEGCKAPIVIDPVMIATSGATLLKRSAILALVKLLPMAALLTPNIPEAEFLLKSEINSPEHMRNASKALHRRYGCAVLLKGGHLKSRSAIDIFYDGGTELLLEAPYVKGVSTHGTGCAYSAAITAWLARGEPLIAAVKQGKEFITQAIAQSSRSGRHDILNSFWKGRPGHSLAPPKRPRRSS
jgi:hydroxymethylpyrimidine/phosphomethylpyrimidine kinase